MYRVEPITPKVKLKWTFRLGDLTVAKCFKILFSLKKLSNFRFC